MSDGADDFKENLEAIRELSKKYPDYDTVMDTIGDRGPVDSISRASRANPPKSHFKELYEEIKNQPEIVNDHPELLELVATMVIDRPGLNNQYLELLVLAVLLEDRTLVSRIEYQIPDLIDRFKSISQGYENIMTKYWALDYRPGTIGNEEGSPNQNTTGTQNRPEAYKKEAAELLDSMKFQAESLGYLLAACAYEYPDQIVPLTPTALELSEISIRDDDELPDHPSVKNMKITSKSYIRRMTNTLLTEIGSTRIMDDPHPGKVGKYGIRGNAIFSDELPPGYLDQLIAHHDKYVHSRLTVFKTIQAEALSDHDAELVEPIIPNLIAMLKMPNAVAALTNVAEQNPELLLPHQDKLRQLLTEGKELEGRSQSKKLEFDSEILTILESVSVSRISNFWEFAQLWITTSEQSSPEIKRAVIDLIGEYIQQGGRLDDDSELIHSLVNDPDWQVRQQVTEILSAGDSSSYHSLLEELSDDPVPEVQEAAKSALNQD